MPSHAKRQARHRRQGTPRFTEPALKELEPKVQQAITAALDAVQAVPVGAMFPYAGSVAPAGYLLAQGQTISSADYPQLAAVVGTTFGGTESNPQLPDTQSLVVVGVDFSNGWTPGLVFGANNVTLAPGMMPSHSHGFSGDQLTNTTTGGSGNRISILQHEYLGNIDRDTTLKGNDNSHNNIQPTIAMYWIIKHD